MVFTRFVEIGRVCLISYGPDTGKLCTIVNVIDHNRVLVDGPSNVTGVHRHSIGIKRLMLTDLKVAVKLNATEKTLKAAWEKEGTLAKWEECGWAKKKKSHALRATATDFDRFRVMVAKKERSKARAAATK
tara:strand:+ start:213 stop:605 length:393 start_codon:yes stop_codon:yes gene_type:complete